MTVDRGYVLVSPCRNEALLMRQTLDSVLAQSVRPAKWVIVDDGSTDATPGILTEYASRHDWISIVTVQDRGNRSVGPGVVAALYAGLESVDLDQFDYFCKLDLDLRLPPRYFEILSERMAADPRLATCSGRPYLEIGGSMVPERHGFDTSLGATKFYRVTAFKDIGGFVQAVAWDGIDCHRCRMKGWSACNWDDPGLRFIHLRPMGSSQRGILTGRVRSGFGQYYMGTGLAFMTVSAIYRLNQRPYVIGSAAMMWGWIRSALQRKPRYDDLEFRKFLRRYHRRVLLVGKRRAVAELAPAAPT